jgi:hypothetical protein
MAPEEWVENLRTKHGYDDEPEIGFEIFGTTDEKTEWLQQERCRLERLAKRATEQAVTASRVDSIRKVMRQEELARMGDVFFGMFPTYSVNAYAGFTPRGDRVVMLHSALPATISAWAKFFLAKVEANSETDRTEHLPTDNDLLLLCYSIGSAWVPEFKPLIPFSGHFTPKTISPVSEDSRSLARVLSESALAFVIGHEIGHILEGHVGYHPTDKTFNHNMEFAADSWGLRLCLRHALRAGVTSDDTFVTKFAMLGPHLAMGTIATIRNVQTGHHPSVDRRFERVQNGVEAELESHLGNRAFHEVLEVLDEDWLLRLRSIGQKLYHQHIELGNLIESFRAVIRHTGAQPAAQKVPELRTLLTTDPR